MNHPEIIQTYLQNYFQVNASEIHIGERLKGGMSNSNYIVTVQGKQYVFRIPGKNADVFVSREIETQTLQLIKPLGIDGNLLIHMEEESGYKISKYTPGTPLLFLNPTDYYEAASAILRQIHDATLLAKNDYDPFNRLEAYEKLVEDSGISHQENYDDIKNRFQGYQTELASIPKTLCHNDSQPSNFILQEDGNLLLVDWEFGGNNDPFYDIACFGNNDFQFAVGLLPVYLKREPTRSEWKRLYLWRVFQCLQWHNVASYKEAIGLSQELHLDFQAIAENYILKANQLFQIAVSFA